MDSYIGTIYIYTDKDAYERNQVPILFEDDDHEVYTEIDFEPSIPHEWKLHCSYKDFYTYARAYAMEASGGFNLLIFPPTSDVWDEIWPSGRVIK